MAAGCQGVGRRGARGGQGTWAGRRLGLQIALLDASVGLLLLSLLLLLLLHVLALLWLRLLQRVAASCWGRLPSGSLRRLLGQAACFVCRCRRRHGSSRGLLLRRRVSYTRHGSGCRGCRLLRLLLLPLRLLAALVEVPDESWWKDALQEAQGGGILVGPHRHQVPAEHAVRPATRAHRAQQVRQDRALCTQYSMPGWGCKCSVAGKQTLGAQGSKRLVAGKQTLGAGVQAGAAGMASQHKTAAGSRVRPSPGQPSPASHLSGRPPASAAPPLRRPPPPPA